MEKTYPNGFKSYLETHFEIVQGITIELLKNELISIVAERHVAQGHGGLYELAEELTDEFEELHKNHVFDGEYLDKIDSFLTEKLTKNSNTMH